MRILVMTSCTGKKRFAHDRQLTLTDFEQGSAHVAAREAELADLMLPAEEMYTGEQQIRLSRGARVLRERLAAGGLDVSLNIWILSAGYGLVPSDRKIAPYECTFRGMKKGERRRWADRLNVPGDVRRVLAQPCDLALLLLGDSYLEACNFEGPLALGGSTLVFCGTQAARRLPQVANLRPVPLTSEEAKRFSCGFVGLKGELARRLLMLVAKEGELVARALFEPETDVLEWLDGVETKGKMLA